MTDTKPTPAEIARARGIEADYRRYQGGVGSSYQLISQIAQAIADARERERERCIGRLNNLIGPGIRDAIEAIRKGEP